MSENSPINLPCPKCGETKSRVVNARGRKRYEGVYRRRQCCKCGHLFTTREVILDDPHIAHTPHAIEIQKKFHEARELARMLSSVLKADCVPQDEPDKSAKVD